MTTSRPAAATHDLSHALQGTLTLDTLPATTLPFPGLWTGSEYAVLQNLRPGYMQVRLY